MSLRFILGRAGSGKTTACLSEIDEELAKSPVGTPLIFLVPEQATFQMEKELAFFSERKGSMRAQVYSFRRLAYRIFLEAGGAARKHIGDLGKRMLLRSIIEKNKKNFKVFARAAGQPHFADTIAKMIHEFKTYGITPQKLEDIIGQMGKNQGNAQLKAKLADLFLMYHEMEEYLKEQYLDPDDYLRLLSEKLPYANSLSQAKIWIDGFSGFTPQEYAVLKSLLKTAQQVNVALCLDISRLSETLREEDLFYITRATYEKLEKIAAELLVPLEKPLLLHEEILPRYKKSPALAHLEKYFFQRPAPKCANSEHLEIIAAANPRVEIEGVARRITRLCRDEGLRFREISVVVRDTAVYSEYLKTIFADHGIPYFIDTKQPVQHHPLLEAVRAALEVIESNWAYEPLFRFLKTDFLPLTRDEVDILENYVLAHGIRGNRWTDEKAWNYKRKFTLGEDEYSDGVDSYLEKINNLRNIASDALKVFAKSLKEQKPLTVRAICRSLYELLERLEIPQKLQTWSEEAALAGQLQSSREHAQVWDGLIGLLDELVEVLGEYQLSVSEFMQIIESGLESLNLGLIPPAVDQVLVASLERSRQPNVRAVFVIGVNDGILPMRGGDRGLINDTERLTLAQYGIELAPDSKRKLLDEQFLTYIALTRSSERLCLSYALSNAEGNALMPSVIISRIKELFPGVSVQTLPVEPNPDDAYEYLTNKGKALIFLTTSLRNYYADVQRGNAGTFSPYLCDVYNYSLSAPELKEKLSLITSALFYVNQENPLKKDTARKIYGRNIRGSVSRLEKFAACPFKHFLAHGLKLKERAYYKLAAPDLGQFFHAAIKEVSDMVAEQKLAWSNLSDEEIAKLTSMAVEKLIPLLQNEILLSSAKLRYLTNKLEKTVFRSVKTIVAHAKRSRFNIYATEIDFGKGERIPPLQLQLSDGSVFEISGRIDRIDTLKIDGKVYVRIIDYKSGKSSLDLTEIFHGLKLQLATYLDVLLSNTEELLDGEAEPAGMLYFPVRSPFIKADKNLSKEELEEEILKDMKTSGYVLADTELVRMMDNSISKYSSLIPVGITKDGAFIKNSSVISKENFRQMRDYLKYLLSNFVERIAEGDVKIEPYEYKQMRSCRFCNYKPICKFDKMLAGNSVRVIIKANDEEVWQRIASVLKGGGDND